MAGGRCRCDGTAAGGPRRCTRPGVASWVAQATQRPPPWPCSRLWPPLLQPPSTTPPRPRRCRPRPCAAGTGGGPGQLVTVGGYWVAGSSGGTPSLPHSHTSQGPPPGHPPWACPWGGGRWLARGGGAVGSYRPAPRVGSSPASRAGPQPAGGAVLPDGCHGPVPAAQAGLPAGQYRSCAGPVGCLGPVPAAQGPGCPGLHSGC